MATVPTQCLQKVCVPWAKMATVPTQCLQKVRSRSNRWHPTSKMLGPHNEWRQGWSHSCYQRCSPSTIHWIHLDAFGGFPSKHQQCIFHPIPFWIFIFLETWKNSNYILPHFPVIISLSPRSVAIFPRIGYATCIAVRWVRRSFAFEDVEKTCSLQYHNYTTINSTFFFNSGRSFKHIALGLPCIHSRSLRGGSNWLATECCMRRWQSPVKLKTPISLAVLIPCGSSCYPETIFISAVLEDPQTNDVTIDERRWIVNTSYPSLPDGLFASKETGFLKSCLIKGGCASQEVNKQWFWCTVLVRCIPHERLIIERYNWHSHFIISWQSACAQGTMAGWWGQSFKDVTWAAINVPILGG